jgi:predicted kinase
MSKLYIIRGISGSGKTTIAKSLGIPNHFEADMWFEKFNGGKFDAAKLKEAHAWCLQQVKESVLSGHDCVVANTFTRRWEYADYLHLAYETFVIIANGRYQNIHGVPEEKVKQQEERFEY